MCDHINWDEIRIENNPRISGNDRWDSAGGSTSIDPPDGMDAPLLHDDNYTEIPIQEAGPSSELWTHCHWSPKVISKAAGPQLLAATIMCGVFMIGELVGGYLAGSLAIMCDAAHLLSDCAGFLLALSALFLARRPPSSRMSYGYRRAEVIGALLSILLIWLVTGIFVYLAILRLWDGNYDIQVNAMMIVSGVGMCVNVVMALILHGACPGLAHMHSHSHSHSHSRPKSNGHLQYSDASNMNGYTKTTYRESKNGYRNLAMDPLLSDGITLSDVQSSTNGMMNQPLIGGSHSKILHSSKTNLFSSINNDYAMKEMVGNSASGISGNPSIQTGFDDVEMLQATSVPRVSSAQLPEVSTEQSINVRAATIHVLGDLIQSAGVFLASVIIKIYPEAKIVDPLCTFVFSIIVMCTTLKILREASNVLMEGVPLQVRYESVLAALRGIAGVRAVHSLHIWSLTNQHNILTVHLAIDQYTDSDSTLKQALNIIRTKFRIDLATVQVERYNEEAMADCVQCSANNDT